jgi:hypothetical protein
MMLACPETEFVVYSFVSVRTFFSCDFLSPQRCYFLAVGSV